VRVFDYRFLQVERFKGNVAPRAIEADILDVPVRQPVVRHPVSDSIRQDQQKESFCHCLPSSFRRSVDLCYRGARNLSLW
jgi:hypothetical protein